MESEVKLILFKVDTVLITKIVELDAELNGWTKPDETTQTEPLASDEPQAEENKQEPPQETVDELITQFNYGDFFRVLKKTKTLVQQYPTAFIFWHIQGTVNIRLGELEQPHLTGPN